MHDRRSPDRKRPRYPGHDYAESAWYFVTICTQHRRCLFGCVNNGQIEHTMAGKAMVGCWHDLQMRFPSLVLDTSVLMPNHLHAIVGFRPVDGEPSLISLPDVMRAFKSISTNVYIHGVRAHGWSPFEHQLWQKSYFDQIIRGERHLERLRAYIESNPRNWE
jgi:REP element-mobilizing transposase RayT